MRAVCVCLAAMMLAGCGGHARSLVRSCGDLGKSVRRADREKIDEGVLPATRSRIDNSSSGVRSTLRARGLWLGFETPTSLRAAFLRAGRCSPRRSAILSSSVVSTMALTV